MKVLLTISAILLVALCAYGWVLVFRQRQSANVVDVMRTYETTSLGEALVMVDTLKSQDFGRLDVMLESRIDAGILALSDGAMAGLLNSAEMAIYLDGLSYRRAHKKDLTLVSDQRLQEQSKHIQALILRHGNELRSHEEKKQRSKIVREGNAEDIR